METRNYETVFIANPNIPEGRFEEINSRTKQIIENHKGKILNLDNWGKKKLAYPINKEAKGQYFCLTYTANNKCVAEIERNMRINEDIFRFLTVKLDETVDPMQAIEAYKKRLEAHAKREKERAERDAERNAERAAAFAARGERRVAPRREELPPVVEDIEIDTEIVDEEE